jgi:hypothetical protein
MQRLKGEAADSEMKLRRWLDGKAKEYGVWGLKHQFNQDTGEIEVYAENIHYEGWQMAFHAEQAAAGQNLWDDTPLE